MPEHLQGPIWWRVLPFPEAAAASGSRAGFPSPLVGVLPGAAVQTKSRCNKDGISVDMK